VLAVRRRWVPQFLWPAAIVTPLAIGLFVYWAASTGWPLAARQLGGG